MKTNPYKAVSYNEKAIEKALNEAGSLIADVKYDGVRLNLLVDVITDAADGEVDTCAEYLSRVAKTIPALEHLNGFSKRWAEFLADDEQPYTQGLMIDGEVMVKGVDFNTGSGLLRTKWLKKANSEFDINGEVTRPVKGSLFEIDPKHLKVVVYGVVPIDIVESGADHDVMNVVMQTHCAVQVALLERHFPEIEWVIAESHDVFDMVTLQKLYESVRELGHEGLVVKDPFGVYRRGKKTGWWKMKPENEADGVIQGLVWGTEGLANEGKVIGFEVLLESGRVVNACNISQKLMNEFTKEVFERNGIEDFPYPSEEYRSHEADEYFNPYGGHQVQIAYMEETPDGSLRHPSFVCFRGTEENPDVKI